MDEKGEIPTGVLKVVDSPSFSVATPSFGMDVVSVHRLQCGSYVLGNAI